MFQQLIEAIRTESTQGGRSKSKSKNKRTRVKFKKTKGKSGTGIYKIFPFLACKR